MLSIVQVSEFNPFHEIAIADTPADFLEILIFSQSHDLQWLTHLTAPLIMLPLSYCGSLFSQLYNTRFSTDLYSALVHDKHYYCLLAYIMLLYVNRTQL